ncbi:D-2-hydroxyacid dehydrogenase family protein [Nocardioides sp.]|uniref:D-2-hydroxyacid dehydrogenase family protein n=1 Tax=Nocardioides sp. TaxID=35761 RepID=UPI003D121639
MRSRVMILDDYQGAALGAADWSRLDDRADVHVLHEHLVGDELVSALQGYDVVVAMRERTPFLRETLGRLPDLRLLVTTGPSNAVIDLEAARANDVVVAGTGGLFHSTAELAWALIHAVTRSVVQEERALRLGQWQVSVGADLARHRLGILGLGRIGQRVARVAKAFDMEVVAWSENLTSERAGEHGVIRLDKDQLLASSDVVSVHLQLSSRTTGLIGSRELGLMQRSACIVNTARGPIIDEAALVEALRSGTIAGAGLDVFDVEPLPRDHPLLSLPNAVLTPHIGYVSRDVYAIFYGDAVDDIDAWLQGTPIRVLT